MRDGGRIALGLAVFLVAATFPVWRGVAADGVSQAPELELPQQASACVEDVAYMRAHHVALLQEWRTAVVRDGQATYTSSTGQEHRMSLTGTCIECHGSAETFCTSCHDYSAVKPDCWNCHIDRTQAAKP